MKFISYDRNTGEWKFEVLIVTGPSVSANELSFCRQVDHFTRYGLDNLYSDEETEDIGCDRPHHVVLAQNSLVKPPYKRQTRDNFSHVLGLDPRRIRFLQRFLFCKTCESQLMNFFPFSQSPPPSIYKMKYEHSLLPVEPSGAGTEEKETSWMPCYVAPEQQQLLQVPPPFANSQFYRRGCFLALSSLFCVSGVFPIGRFGAVLPQCIPVGRRSCPLYRFKARWWCSKGICSCGDPKDKVFPKVKVGHISNEWISSFLMIIILIDLSLASFLKGSRFIKPRSV
jgi:hypothetical protein